MSVFLSAASLFLTLSVSLPARAEGHVHRKRASSKHPPARVESHAPLELAAPGNVPPGAQLTADRVIEAPRAPAPGVSSEERVSVPARDVPPKRHHGDRVDDGSRPSYPTGPDPGRNMEPDRPLSPSGLYIVP